MIDMVFMNPLFRELAFIRQALPVRSITFVEDQGDQNTGLVLGPGEMQEPTELPRGPKRFSCESIDLQQMFAADQYFDDWTCGLSVFLSINDANLHWEINIL